jgi:hypothetical protein
MLLEGGKELLSMKENKKPLVLLYVVLRKRCWLSSSLKDQSDCTQKIC